MRREPGAVFGLLCAGLVVSLGTLWAFQRGAPDFAVFHSAWTMVLAGRGLELYNPSATPDRFLYAPGFAWLFSPLGWLPFRLALALWCLMKAATVGFLIRALALGFSARARGHSAPSSALSAPTSAQALGVAHLGVAAWALVLVARPFLIDFHYGQVNVLILAAAVWALYGHFDPDRSPAADVASWAVLAVAAVTKVFPLPLLLVPWLAFGPAFVASPAKLRRERAGLVGGLLVAALAPLLSLSVTDAIHLYVSWGHALMAKGLPLESHNQSFIALLHHYFSGEPTFVLAEGLPPLPFGAQVFSSQALALLSFAWTFAAMGMMVAWILKQPGRPNAYAQARWCAVVIALMIIPSHLIWKPYFVMSLPVAALFLALDRSKWLPFALFFAVNLTGFDFLGHHLGALFEAAAVLLIVHLALTGWAIYFRREKPGSPIDHFGSS